MLEKCFLKTAKESEKAFPNTHCEEYFEGISENETNLSANCQNS